MSTLPDLEIIAVDFKQAAHLEDYQAMLSAYAVDPMGGGQRFTKTHCQQVTDDLAQLTHARCFLAYRHQQAVGFATCFTAYSTFSAAPLWNIHDLAVVAHQRKRGIGSQLIQAIGQAATSEGASKLTLEVREDNPQAASLYKTQGFSSADVGGKCVQYLFLEKQLQA